MELHKLCCFLTQGRELPYFWSSTMEVQSFISLKLQTAFPTVWLSFFNKATFTPHFVQSTFYSQYIKFTENSFLYHFLTWIKAIFYASYHLYRLFRWSTPQTRPWAVWLQHWFFAEPSKLAKNWSWHTKYSSVPQICPPPALCNLSLSAKCRGAYMRDATISLAITPSLPGMKLLSVGGGGQARGVAEHKAERSSWR